MPKSINSPSLWCPAEAFIEMGVFVFLSNAVVREAYMEHFTKMFHFYIVNVIYIYIIYMI